MIPKLLHSINFDGLGQSSRIPIRSWFIALVVIIIASWDFGRIFDVCEMGTTVFLGQSLTIVVTETLFAFVR